MGVSIYRNTWNWNWRKKYIIIQTNKIKIHTLYAITKQINGLVTKYKIHLKTRQYLYTLEQILLAMLAMLDFTCKFIAMHNLAQSKLSET